MELVFHKYHVYYVDSLINWLLVQFGNAGAFTVYYLEWIGSAGSADFESYQFLYYNSVCELFWKQLQTFSVCPW